MFLDEHVDEQLPSVAVNMQTANGDKMQSDDVMNEDKKKEEAVEQSDEVVPSPQETPNIVQWTGSFIDGDATHKAVGSITTIDAEGTKYLRFEELDVTNGPDLYVYLREQEQQH